MRWMMSAAAAVGLAAPLMAQAPAVAVRDDVRAWRRTHEAEILRELADLLALPNVASDSVDIHRNADALVTLLGRRGVPARRLELPGSPPAVFGELRVPGATRTVVLYAHYDGQPADSAAWRTPPWQPVLRAGMLEAGAGEIPLPAAGETVDPEARLYARSAGDDKSPIIAMLAALDALHASGRRPSVNVKFFFEGEEEAGSRHIRPMLERYADLLRADLWLFCDGPMHQSRRPQLVFGVRGVAGFSITVYGATRILHSGHYGNWAPNPAVRLARLVASMRDDDGHILLDGFYDDVRAPTAVERQAVAILPAPDSSLRVELNLAATEDGDALLAERVMMPALNVDGLSSGYVGSAASNAIPSSATASFDFRLVPDQRPARLRALVEAHLRRQGYEVVSTEPDSAMRARYPRLARLGWGGGYAAQRTPLDAPASRAVVDALQPVLAEPLIEVPTLGGSLPLVHFADVLHAPLIIVPTVNHDDNQHGANENLRLQNLWDAIETFGVLLVRLGPEWRQGS